MQSESTYIVHTQDDEDDEIMDHMHPILVKSKGQQDQDHHQQNTHHHGSGMDHESEADSNNTAAKLTIAYR